MSLTGQIEQLNSEMELLKRERDDALAKLAAAEACCAEMRGRLERRIEWCCTPDGSPDGGFKYCDHCTADLRALGSDCGKDHIPRSAAEAATVEAVRPLCWALRDCVSALRSSDGDSWLSAIKTGEDAITYAEAKWPQLQ